LINDNIISSDPVHNNITREDREIVMVIFTMTIRKTVLK